MTPPPSGRPGPLASVERALGEIQAGRMIVLVDDEDRENEGDLVMAADKVTPEAVNFMARFGRGLICLSLTEERVEQLGLRMMVDDNRSPRSTAFTVSVDARVGTTTGISARERSDTIRAAITPEAKPDDLIAPGHIFPLRARRGGVLVRSGHTEGSVDLARLAGFEPAGVICEIMRDDGEMARMPDLVPFAAQHGMVILTIADLIEYRLSQEILVRKAYETELVPGTEGASRSFRAAAYTTEVEDTEYLALVLGTPRPDQPTLVRVQTSSVLRDVFAAGGGPTGAGVGAVLRMIEDAGQGVLLYVFPGGRANMLAELRGYAVAGAARPAAADTGGVPISMAQPADVVVRATPGAGWPESSGPVAAPPVAGGPLRDFGLGAQVLADLGCGKIRLITNNPRRVVGASGYGLDIVECLPIRAPAKVLPLRGQEP